MNAVFVRFGAEHRTVTLLTVTLHHGASDDDARDLLVTGVNTTLCVSMRATRAHLMFEEDALISLRLIEEGIPSIVF